MVLTTACFPLPHGRATWGTAGPERGWPPGAASGLLVAQRLDRVQPGRLDGGVDAEEDADQRRHREGQEDGVGRDHRLHRLGRGAAEAEAVEQPRAAAAEQDADRAADAT